MSGRKTPRQANKLTRRRLSIFIFTLSLATPGFPQAEKPAQVRGTLTQDLREFVAVPAIPGYEAQLVEKIRSELAAFHPVTDNLGDILVTIGSGAPRRLIVTPIDEPGFVVSAITEEGYLRLQRLPQFVLPPIFNELYSAQPVMVGTAGDKWVDGVVAGLSVHLQPGRTNPPKSSDPENMYVDIGASSAVEARKSGVDVLSPVAINRQVGELGSEKLAAASIGDRFGAAALVEILRVVDPHQIKGTLTFAFVVQQWTGARGLQRVLRTTQPDEIIYVGRLRPGGPVAGMESMHRAPRREPGSGVLLGLEQANGVPAGLGADLKQLADANKIPFETDYSSGLIPANYLHAPSLPDKWAHLAIATSWPETPAETIDSSDLANLLRLLDQYVEGPQPSKIFPASAFGDGLVRDSNNRGNKPPNPESILANLVGVYGVSNHEGPVRDRVKQLLPKWAQTETDDVGNLILHLGATPAGSKAPRLLFVAHMDEIGFEVKSISKDGRLEVEWRGGGDLSFFAGHPALVHTASGDRAAVMDLPSGWDEAKFEWPKESEKAIRVEVGARTPEDVAKLGIQVGDSLSIPKAYRPLLGKRAIGRSFDDRVGDTALISAVWALGGPLKDRDVTFVWSTGEELGLVGAAAVAKRLAAEGHAPEVVFAVDTFVSSDSPLESRRFASAELGRGFVVRAVDNSNIVPRNLVEKVLKFARSGQIPAQYGVTGGGNDGAAFVPYGSVDVALGWPLRYAHSPAEVIDTRDLEALARIVTILARSW